MGKLRRDGFKPESTGYDEDTEEELTTQDDELESEGQRGTDPA